MQRPNKKPFIFCWKICKYLIHPLKRIRKLRKLTMRQYRIAISALATVTCFLTLTLYYWHRVSQKGPHKVTDEGLDNFVPPRRPNPIKPFHHMPLSELYPDGNKDDTSVEQDVFQYDKFINTPGCKIPVSLVQFKDKRKKIGTCGKRAVMMKKIGADSVKAIIREKIIKSYLRKSATFQCCYRFILQSNETGVRNRKMKIRFTSCNKFEDGAVIMLESDFVNVKCFEQRKNTSHEVYDDVYAFTKIINVTEKPRSPCKRMYNVILLGMDSMSLSRFAQVMTRTSQFFKDNSWLAYRGFHKVGDNTLPNLMAAMTGQNMSTFAKNCAGKLDECKKMLIWNKFEEEGYVTAYGEDFLRLPDTFHGDYKFKNPPTHHYLRPLFVKGETEPYNKSLICAGKIPSAQHLLDYALDFAMTYRSQSFFGLFWINLYSHDENNRPQDADNMIESFFNRLTYTGVLDNTFIIFFSDHGVRFGKYRLEPASYYDERLPFMFIWSPNFFTGRHRLLFKYLAYNQYKLVTPYDLYNTLIDIHQLSVCDRTLNTTETTSVAEGCPKCHSLFSLISENRTCQDAGIDDRWCSCHKLFPLHVHDTEEAAKSVQLIESSIKNLSKSVKTKRCWSCMTLELKNVIRIHFYYDNAKVNLFHVVAVTMTPGNMSYEGVVLFRGNKAELLGSVSVISGYKGLGQCTVNPKENAFCVCQKMSNCT